MGSASAWTPVADTSAWTPVAEGAAKDVNTKFGKGNSIFDSPLLVNTPPGSSTNEHTGEAIASPQSQLAVAALTGTGLEAAAAAAGHTLPSFLGKLAIGTMAGGLAHKGARSVGLPEWAATAAGLVGGAAGMSSTGELGNLLSEYKGPDSILGFLRFAAGKSAKQEAVDPLLDGIAQGFKYKDYASAPDDAKLIIERLAKASNEAPVPRPVRPSPPVSPSPPVETPAPVAAPQAHPQPNPYRPDITFVPGRPVRPPVQTEAQANATAMHAAMDRLRASGLGKTPALPPVAVEPAAIISPEVAAPSPMQFNSEFHSNPDPKIGMTFKNGGFLPRPGDDPGYDASVKFLSDGAISSEQFGAIQMLRGLTDASTPEPLTAEPKSELEDLLERSLNNEKVTEQAKAELSEHLKLESLKKTVDIIDRNQTQRALKLGRFLQDHAIQPEHIERMTPEEWQSVGALAEVDSPSATTIQKTKDLLKMGQPE